MIGSDQNRVLSRRRAQPTVLLVLQALPLSILKVIDFTERQSRAVFFWRLSLQHMIQGARDEGHLVETFAKVAADAKLSTLRGGLKLFLKAVLGPWIVQKGAAGLKMSPDEHGELLLRVNLAERALVKST